MKDNSERDVGLVYALERIAEALEYANQLKAFELDLTDGAPENGDLDGDLMAGEL